MDNSEVDRNLLRREKPEKSWPVTIAVACFMILLPMAINVIGGLGVGDVLETTWFQNMDIAVWSPPNWALGIIWLILYFSMGTSSFLIWHTGVKRGVDVTVPLLFYAVHLLVAAYWIPLVLGRGYFILGAVDWMLVFILVLVCIFLFWPINRTAAIIMIPYAIFIAYDNTISIYMAIYNKSGRPPCQ